MYRRLFGSFVALALSTASLAPARAAKDLTCKWWLSLDVDQRVAFIAGYIDCYTDVKKGPALFVESWYTYEKRVAERLRSHPGEMSSAISVVLTNTAARPARSEAERIAGRTGAMHVSGDVFDGEYWRQMAPLEKTAFVTGFLECNRHDRPTRTLYPHTPESYAIRISQWYGTRDGDPGVIKRDREKVSIHSVILRISDGRQSHRGDPDDSALGQLRLSHR